MIANGISKIGLLLGYPAMLITKSVIAHQRVLSFVCLSVDYTIYQLQFYSGCVFKVKLLLQRSNTTNDFKDKSMEGRIGLIY